MTYSEFNAIGWIAFVVFLLAWAGGIIAGFIVFSRFARESRVRLINLLFGYGYMWPFLGFAAVAFIAFAIGATWGGWS